MDGILLLANGQAVDEDLFRLAEEIRSDLGKDAVEIAYLADRLPDIPSAVLTCVKRGVTRLHIIPWLLPEEVLQAAEQAVRLEVEEFRGLRMQLEQAAYEDAQVYETIQVFLEQDKVIEEEDLL